MTGGEPGDSDHVTSGQLPEVMATGPAPHGCAGRRADP
jgi:hypothetical protein